MKYIISIPKPCHEDWNKMTPTEQGRFCDVCAKEVLDMTQLSNRELVNKLKNNENVCGRYKASQLDVDLYANSNTGLSRVGLLFSLTSLFAVAQPAIAQQDTIKNTTQVQEKVNATEKATTQTDSIVLRGTVIDEIGTISGVNVQIKGTNYKTVTDTNGKFEFVIPQKKSVTLLATFKDYTKEIPVKDLQKEVIIDIGYQGVTTSCIKPQPKSVKGYTVQILPKKSKKSFFVKLTNIFRKKENRR